jgi:hypothetical protein
MEPGISSNEAGLGHTVEPGPGYTVAPGPSLSNNSIGIIAYRRRKQALWQELVIKADLIFTQSNPAYQSPM